MKKIQKLLSDWVYNELITTSQMEKIIQYENGKQKKDKTKWVLFSFLTLGGSIIGTGIISLIASNWDVIPPAVKLIINFTILSILGYFIYTLYCNKKYMTFDVLSLIFIILCLASIGLISQVYHTGGELYQALFFWLIIILPLASISKNRFTPYLWITFLIITYFIYGFSQNTLWDNISSRYYDKERFFSVVLSLPALSFLCVNISSYFKKLKYFLEATNLYLILSALFIIFLFDFSISDDMMNFDGYKFTIPFIILLILSLIAYLTRKDILQKEKIILSIFIGFSFIVFVASSYFHDNIKYNGEFLAPLYSIPALILMAVLFSIKNLKKIFHLTTLMIGIRFLIIYFQVFQDLAITGFGLILSGVIIMGVSYLWFKSRNKIEEIIQEHIK